MNVAFLDGYWNFFLHEYFFSSHKHNNFCEIFIYIYIYQKVNSLIPLSW